MAQDYSEWLAVEVLSEKKYVNYRNVSRALKVHSNLAKQMLYDFHTKQNARKPNSVHATYILTGTKRSSTTSSQDDDVSMTSSPPLPSSSFQHEEEKVEVIPIRAVMLVKEEDLEKAKAGLESVTGMHVYSLQVGGVSDVQVLTECNRRVAVEFGGEDPLIAWGTYGVVGNGEVRRRARGQQPPPVAARVAATTKAAAAEKKAVAEKPAAKTAPATNPAAPAQKTTTTTTSKPTAANKNQNSSIFKSFAKGSANAAASKKKAPVVEPEDIPMTGFSSDDEDDDSPSLPADLEPVRAPAGETRNERKSRLEAMMDDDDDDDEPVPDPTADDHVPDPTADEEMEDADEGAIDAPVAEEPKETMTVENGRRRGRRRVMKKKTVKDADGYLVTREEAVWESFSEDEPAPKKAKMSSAAPSRPAAGGKKGGAGQGNIMSFFKKG